MVGIFTGRHHSNSSTATFNITVTNFAALPAASSYTGKMALVLEPQGTIFVDRKPRGLYYSDGATWEHKGDYSESDEATEVEVNPAGFTNATGDDVQEVLGELDTAITDHAGAADPHTQYILVDGTRAFTGDQTFEQGVLIQGMVDIAQTIIASTASTGAATYTITTEHTLSCTATCTVDLPASPATGQMHTIRHNKATAGTITIDGNGNNINGSATIDITQRYLTRTVQYDGTEWMVI